MHARGIDQPAPKRTPRSDGRRNRERLLDAAQQVFAEEGLNAPLDRIASRAGVGPGTLYRHFPSRLELWAAVLQQPLRDQLSIARAAYANPNGWEAISGYILAMCRLEAEERGYLNLMTARFEDIPELFVIRREIHLLIQKLIERARADGTIRADFTMEDLIFIAVSNSAIVAATAHHAPDAWRRNAEFFLEAIRPERAHPLSTPPLRPSQVFRSMMKPATGRRRQREDGTA